MSHGAQEKGEIVEHVHGFRVGTSVALAWDTSGDAPRSFQVLRSPVADADEVEDVKLMRLRQRLVFKGDATEMRDDDTLASAGCYYYALFAKDAEGVWHKQMAAALRQGGEVHWARVEDSGQGSSFERFTELRKALPEA